MVEESQSPWTQSGYSLGSPDQQEHHIRAPGGGAQLGAPGLEKACGSIPIHRVLDKHMLVEGRSGLCGWAGPGGAGPPLALGLGNPVVRMPETWGQQCS